MPWSMLSRELRPLLLNVSKMDIELLNAFETFVILYNPYYNFFKKFLV